MTKNQKIVMNSCGVLAFLLFFMSILELIPMDSKAGMFAVLVMLWAALIALSIWTHSKPESENQTSTPSAYHRGFVKILLVLLSFMSFIFLLGIIIGGGS